MCDSCVPGPKEGIKLTGVFWPWASCEEFKVTEWLVSSGALNKKLDKFLKTRYVSFHGSGHTSKFNSFSGPWHTTATHVKFGILPVSIATSIQ